MGVCRYSKIRSVTVDVILELCLGHHAMGRRLRKAAFTISSAEKISDNPERG
jgi:hypothetical protein